MQFRFYRRIIWSLDGFTLYSEMWSLFRCIALCLVFFLMEPSASKWANGITNMDSILTYAESGSFCQNSEFCSRPLVCLCPQDVSLMESMRLWKVINYSTESSQTLLEFRLSSKLLNWFFPSCHCKLRGKKRGEKRDSNGFPCYHSLSIVYFFHELFFKDKEVIIMNEKTNQSAFQ